MTTLLKDFKLYGLNYVIYREELYTALGIDNSSFDSWSEFTDGQAWLFTNDVFTIEDKVYLSLAFAKHIATYGDKVEQRVKVFEDILELEKRDFIKDLANAIPLSADVTRTHVTNTLKQLNSNNVNRALTKRFVVEVFTIINRIESTTDKLKYLRELAKGLKSFRLILKYDSDKLFILELEEEIYEQHVTIASRSRGGLKTKIQNLEKENNSIRNSTFNSFSNFSKEDFEDLYLANPVFRKLIDEFVDGKHEKYIDEITSYLDSFKNKR